MVHHLRASTVALEVVVRQIGLAVARASGGVEEDEGKEVETAEALASTGQANEAVAAAQVAVVAWEMASMVQEAAALAPKGAKEA